jgi:2-oxoglutarate ferredoxin oxidoreductase subunit beta
MVHNNQLYALTKGQGSPTTPKGEPTRLQFDGMPVSPIDFLAIAIAHECGFVARGYARDLDELVRLMVRAIQHRGLSLLEIVQPCITWSRHPMDWYDERVEPVPEDHDPGDRGRAIELAREAPDCLRTGILYKRPARELFGDAFRDRVGDRPLADLRPVGKSLIEERISARFVDVDRSAA